MDMRFSCTACGKCCFGWVPLTIPEALAHAGRFPLAVVWAPVRAIAGREPAAGVGLLVSVGQGRVMPVRVAPTAYIPPSFRCPELRADGLCGIHQTKPIRCRTMPLIGWRDPDNQADLLTPRPGWDCDVGETAPVVWRDGAIIDPSDWRAEHDALAADQPTIRAFAAMVMQAEPRMGQILAHTATQVGGNVVMGFGTLLRRLTAIDAAEVAARQRPVLDDFAARTAHDPDLADYHARYTSWSADLARPLRS
jgi:Fe-S-cluster containining protein